MVKDKDGIPSNMNEETSRAMTSPAASPSSLQAAPPRTSRRASLLKPRAFVADEGVEGTRRMDSEHTAKGLPLSQWLKYRRREKDLVERVEAIGESNLQQRDPELVSLVGELRQKHEEEAASKKLTYGAMLWGKLRMNGKLRAHLRQFMLNKNRVQPLAPGQLARESSDKDSEHGKVDKVQENDKEVGEKDDPSEVSNLNNTARRGSSSDATEGPKEKKASTEKLTPKRWNEDPNVPNKDEVLSTKIEEDPRILLEDDSLAVVRESTHSVQSVSDNSQEEPQFEPGSQFPLQGEIIATLGNGKRRTASKRSPLKGSKTGGNDNDLRASDESRSLSPLSEQSLSRRNSKSRPSKLNTTEKVANPSFHNGNNNRDTKSPQKNVTKKKVSFRKDSNQKSSINISRLEETKLTPNLTAAKAAGSSILKEKKSPANNKPRKSISKQKKSTDSLLNRSKAETNSVPRNSIRKSSSFGEDDSVQDTRRPSRHETSALHVRPVNEPNLTNVEVSPRRSLSLDVGAAAARVKPRKQSVNAAVSNKEKDRGRNDVVVLDASPPRKHFNKTTKTNNRGSLSDNPSKNSTQREANKSKSLSPRNSLVSNHGTQNPRPSLSDKFKSSNPLNDQASKSKPSSPRSRFDGAADDLQFSETTATPTIRKSSEQRGRRGYHRSAPVLRTGLQQRRRHRQRRRRKLRQVARLRSAVAELHALDGDPAAALEPLQPHWSPGGSPRQFGPMPWMRKKVWGFDWIPTAHKLGALPSFYRYAPRLSSDRLYRCLVRSARSERANRRRKPLAMPSPKKKSHAPAPVMRLQDAG